MKGGLNRLSILHIFNDGFEASILLLLPFIAKDMGLNLTSVGFLGSSMGLLQIFLALPASYFAVKVGGMRFLLICALLYGVGYFSIGLAGSFLLLVFSYILAGVGFGTFHPVAFALVSRLSDKGMRGKVMGSFTAIGDLGRIGISIVITFLIVHMGWRTSAFLYAGAAFAIFALVGAFSRTTSNIAKNTVSHKVHVRIRDILASRKFLYACATNMLDSFASSSLFVFLPFLLLKRGVNPAVLGSFTAAFFVGNFMGKTLLGRFVDRFGNTPVFIVSELFMALFIVILANSANFILIIGASIVLGIFTKGTVPVVKTMVSESVEHHGNYEKAFGLNSIASGISTALAPIILGFFSDKLGIVAAFNISAVVALLAIFPAFAFSRTKIS